ncbi:MULTISPECIES: EAL domain-containing protein [unclassified Pseudomonas]|uniref:EAL domain-containing response regulator n=1 Tax=unclassified Pseudomonas TaxID=196821 RepID=UPI000537EE02|nr:MULTISPECIES: EAL domain-containing response regulator [unclassified Pseudomonas]MBD0683041.1 hypothetical protein [Pseudomonas sp. PSB18]CDF92579.1 hypothetical protein BN844_2003 [Pseudomonas sp. SHC52]
MSMSALRVMVLEDHSFQRSVAVSVLRELGCGEIFQAADGAKALGVLEKVGPVDIVLCDLRMEGMDGLGFLQAAGPAGLVASVILCSSLSSDLRRTVRQIIPFLGLEFLGDIGKPLRYEALELLVGKYLSTPRTRKAPREPIRLPTEAKVRQALAAGEFQAHFQPKFQLDTGEIRGVEVLARWQQPDGKISPPSHFMPVLERCGLMDELLFRQIRQSLELQQRLRVFGYDLNFAFNLQAEQLLNTALAPRIQALLDEHDARGGSLTFELTESGLLQLSEANLECLFRLRMMGCGLSIDDFGAGFSSLHRLCQLPFSEIKLDAEFIRTALYDPRCRAVISSTLALGETLGMTVVIEGIETQEQQQLLLGLGGLYGQGYWCAKAMSGDDLLQWLLTGSSRLIDA